MTLRNRQLRFGHALKLLGMFLLLALLPMTLAAGQGGPPGKVPPVQTFDYHDFGSGQTTQRVFAVSNGDGVTQVIEDIARAPGYVFVTRSYWSGPLRLRYSVYTFMPTETDLLMASEEAYDGDGTLLHSSDYQPPLSIRQSSMPLGALQGSAAVRLRTPAGSPDIFEQGTTRWNVALGLDDVSVPYGELAGCLRLLEQHNSTLRMIWFYPGIGPVQRVQSDNGPIWTLTGCTGCP